jgi:Zinc carboxypeptidase
MSRRYAALILCGLGIATGVAKAQTIAAPPSQASVAPEQIQMGLRYYQSADVKARYPNVAIAIETPALREGRTTLTSQEELESFLSKLAQPTAPMVVETLAKTPQGRALPLLTFTRERLIDPAAIRATGRPIIWLIGQQHGNEPAGGEAMLAVAKSLAEGELQPLLDRIVVVMMPRANPDGAAANTRDTSARMDLNRDHATLALPETRALHTAIQRLPPDLVIDAHEFSVAQRWLEKFGALQAADLMVLDATHPMVPESAQRFARQNVQPAIEAAMEQYGLRHMPYHTTSTRRSDRSIALGGNASGIARNAFGLSGAVSFLLETRGVGIGMEGYQRRVATHYLAIRAALQVAAEKASDLRAAVTASRRHIVEQSSTVIVRHTVETESVTLPLIDAATGVDIAAETIMSNSKRVAVTTRRPWPAGYVVRPEAQSSATELRLLGAQLCTIARDVEINAEMFEVHDRSTNDRRAINPDAAVRAIVRDVRVAIPAGSIFVPASQPAGNRIVLALEPDAPGSFVAVDVVRTPPDSTTVPIIRILAGARLPLVPATPDDASACRAP